MESVTGFSDPAANGATVKGMRPAETILCVYCQSPHAYHNMHHAQSETLSCSICMYKVPQATHLSKLQ